MMTRQTTVLRSTLIALSVLGPQLAVAASPPNGDAMEREPRQFALGDAIGNIRGLTTARGHTIVMSGVSTSFPGPRDRTLTVIDRAGITVWARTPGEDIPDLSVLLLTDAVITRQQMLWVAMQTASKHDKQANVLIQYDLTRGSLQRIVRTNPVSCFYIAADDDGSLWCLGPSRGEQPALFHHFTADGVYDRGVVPLADFKEKGEPQPWLGSRHAQPVLAVVNGNLHAWLPGNELFVTLDKTGKLIQQLEVSAWDSPGSAREQVVFGADGGAIALIVLPTPDQQWRSGLFELDQEHGTWRPMVGVPSFEGAALVLVGSDGDELTFLDRSSGTIKRRTRTELAGE